MLTDLSYSAEIAAQSEPFVAAFMAAHPAGVAADAEYKNEGYVALSYASKTGAGVEELTTTWGLTRLEDAWVVDKRVEFLKLADGTTAESTNYLTGEGRGVVSDMLTFYAFAHAISKHGCEECIVGDCPVDHTKAGFDMLYDIISVAEEVQLYDGCIDLGELWAGWRTEKLLEEFRPLAVRGFSRNDFVSLRGHFRDYQFNKIRWQKKDHFVVFLHGPEHDVGVRFERDPQRKNVIRQVVVMEGDALKEELFLSGDEDQAKAIFSKVCTWYEEITGDDCHKLVEVMRE